MKISTYLYPNGIIVTECGHEGLEVSQAKGDSGKTFVSVEPFTYIYCGKRNQSNRNLEWDRKMVCGNEWFPLGDRRSVSPGV